MTFISVETPSNPAPVWAGRASQHGALASLRGLLDRLSLYNELMRILINENPSGSSLSRSDELQTHSNVHLVLAEDYASVSSRCKTKHGWAGIFFFFYVSESIYGGVWA